MRKDAASRGRLAPGSPEFRGDGAALREEASILEQIERGGPIDPESDAYIGHLYAELTAIARRVLDRKGGEREFEPEDLVNDFFARVLSRKIGTQFNEVEHLKGYFVHYAIHKLVDEARKRGRQIKVDISEARGVPTPAQTSAIDLTVLDEALDELEKIAPRSARIVELRYIAGCTEKEAAEALGISIATLKRDWAFAKAWLAGRLR